MAIRKWLVRPDHEVPGVGPDGEDILIPAVSSQACAQAALEAVTIVHRIGGGFTYYAARAKTGIPGERVTSGAMIEWKNQTDAKAQPETDGAALPLRAVPEPADVEPEVPAEAPAPELAAVADPEPREATIEDNVEADESSVPARLRGA